MSQPRPHDDFIGGESSSSGPPPLPPLQTPPLRPIGQPLPPFGGGMATPQRGGGGGGAGAGVGVGQGFELPDSLIPDIHLTPARPARGGGGGGAPRHHHQQQQQQQQQDDLNAMLFGETLIPATPPPRTIGGGGGAAVDPFLQGQHYNQQQQQAPPPPNIALHPHGPFGGNNHNAHRGGGGGGGGGGAPPGGGAAAASLYAQQQQQQQAQYAAVPQGAGRDPALTYLWGTNVSLEEFKQHFKQFLGIFRTTKSFEDALRRAHLCDLRQLEIDFSALRDISPHVYVQTVCNPAEALRMMGAVMDELFAGVRASLRAMAAATTTPSRNNNNNSFNTPQQQPLEDEMIIVAPFNMPQCVSLRALSPPHIETLVAVRGLVVRTSKIIPEVRVAHFQCWVCRFSERVAVERGRITEPARCGRCAKQQTYQLIHNLSVYEDKQLIRVQEAPENLADGETPVTVSVVVYRDLVDAVVPGDRVIVTGIYRAAPLKLNANTRIIKSVFKTHLDAAHIEKSTSATKTSGDNATAKNKKNNAAAGDENEDGEAEAPQPQTARSSELDLSDLNLVAKLRQLARRPDIYDLLRNSLAPAIWGHDDVKKGILCQLFAGSRKVFRHGKFRSELNIILCGDPGVAKSQLLSRVHSISPRGVYTSGKGSSSVGLTAFVVRDADTGEFVLEPGALVLSDNGVCCIDEFDKMGEDTRSVLHEVMEQQTLSVAKAGIIAQLNARTSVLAAANPKESQWNPTLNIVENLQIEPTLLSRFDLIYLLLDKKDEALDRHLAKHVLAMFMEKAPPKSAAPATATAAAILTDDNDVDTTPSALQSPTTSSSTGLLSDTLFSQYVAFAKATCNPVITEEAQAALALAYVELRRGRSNNSGNSSGGSSGGMGGRTVSATLRQLESMIRIAEANAKMRLATEVTIADVQESKRLISSALKEAATDPRTGLINLEMFAAPDQGKITTETLMIRLERIIEGRYASIGKKSASVNELRHALQEAIGGTGSSSGSSGSSHRHHHLITPNQFMEVLALLSDGPCVSTYTATTVTFASSGGGGGNGGSGNATNGGHN